MERVLKQVINILNQNAVHHSVVQEDISKTDFCMVDVYSVNVIVEQPLARTISKKSSKKIAKRSKKIAEPQLISVPILQVKYNPTKSNIKIVLDNECIYNNDKFQDESAVSIGYGKKSAEPVNPSLKKILDICKTKSTVMHLDYLKRAKELLKEQRKVLFNVR